MQALVYGIVCLVLGILGFIYWWHYFFSILKGLLPLALIIAGLMALSTGIGMVRGSSQSSPNEDEKK